MPKFILESLPGACCFTPQNGDPVCRNVSSEAQCNSTGDRFYPGESCSGNPCIKQPCCFRDGTCENHTPSFCILDRQGAPVGVRGDRCGGSTCPQLSSACCRPDGSCVETETLEECEAQQGGWFQGIRCEDITCSRLITGACCLPNGRCLPDRTEDACRLEGGVFFPDVDCIGLDCPEFPPPPGCLPIDLEAHTPPGGKNWGIGLCHPIFLEPQLYPEENKFARMLGLNLVRAKEPDWSVFFGEPCGYHWGDYALNSEGFLEGYFCSEPQYGVEDHRQQSRTQTVIQIGEDPEAIIEPGFVAELGFYHAPYWTEILFHSHQPRCNCIA